LKEWVSLEGEEYKPPRIRIASNITGLRNEGTRKRQRAAMVDYNWSVGDRVDAWVEDRYSFTLSSAFKVYLFDTNQQN